MIIFTVLSSETSVAACPKKKKNRDWGKITRFSLTVLQLESSFWHTGSAQYETPTIAWHPKSQIYVTSEVSAFCFAVFKTRKNNREGNL